MYPPTKDAPKSRVICRASKNAAQAPRAGASKVITLNETAAFDSSVTGKARKATAGTEVTQVRLTFTGYQTNFVRNGFIPCATAHGHQCRAQMKINGSSPTPA